MFWSKVVIVREAEVGLLYENGEFRRMLEPGRYRLANLPWRRQEVTRVDMRRRALMLPGQEMLTADGISVRLNVAVEYRVVNAPVALHTVVDYQAALYTA